MKYQRESNVQTIAYPHSTGFSFIEVMVVIIILGLLAGLVGVSLFGSVDKAKVDTTQNQIRQIEGALELYRLHNERYPDKEQGLDALMKKPEIGRIPKNWNGPYVRGKNLPVDGWGNPFVYKGDGTDFEIVSYGADGVEGGADADADISSTEL